MLHLSSDSYAGAVSIAAQQHFAPGRPLEVAGVVVGAGQFDMLDDVIA